MGLFWAGEAEKDPRSAVLSRFSGSWTVFRPQTLLQKFSIFGQNSCARTHKNQIYCELFVNFSKQLTVKSKKCGWEVEKIDFLEVVFGGYFGPVEPKKTVAGPFRVVFRAPGRFLGPKPSSKNFRFLAKIRVPTPTKTKFTVSCL